MYLDVDLFREEMYSVRNPYESQEHLFGLIGSKQKDFDLILNVLCQAGG